MRSIPCASIVMRCTRNHHAITRPDSLGRFPGVLFLTWVACDCTDGGREVPDSQRGELGQYIRGAASAGGGALADMTVFWGVMRGCKKRP